MRDVAIIAILAGFTLLAFHRPWLGVLGLAVLSYMNPHTYTNGFMSGFPVYVVLFVTVCLATLRALVARTGDVRWPPKDWRLAAFVCLWGYFLFTTTQAMVPWYAWPRFWELTKILVPLGLTLILIDTREKLLALIATIAASVALVTVKGGYWAVMTGFRDRVYGPPDSHFYDNNHFAVLVVMNIPLLVLWLRETADRRLRAVLMVVIALSAAAALSSWSRGALLALTVTAMLMLWHSRRKYLALLLLLAAVLLALAGLPDTWFARMETIAHFEEDGSARGRLFAWQAGIAYALKHPFTGSGFEGWRYVTQHKDWHSAYVEVAAEHGLVGLGIWLSLLLGTLVSLTRLARFARGRPELAWVSDYSLMLRASLVAYAVGTAFLGLSYWDIWFHLVIIAVVLRRVAVEAGTPGATLQQTTSRGAPRLHPRGYG